ncbi:MAG: hypothetical protein XD90_2155 [Methanobacterium sp. 42_16]|jgi:hypothetical protein|nr:MAG: hypothetical protein XD90_2155 [Methanobacterium sp. 42_16]
MAFKDILKIQGLFQLDNLVLTLLIYSLGFSLAIKVTK